MVRKSDIQVLLAANILELYFFFSFAASALICLGLYLTGPDFFSVGLFPAWLFVGHWGIYQSNGSPFAVIKASKWFPLLFVFQIIGLLGTSFYHDLQAGPYLALIPLMAGSYYFLNHEAAKGGRPEKVVTLIGVFLFSALFFYGQVQTWQWSPKEYLTFGVFGLWSGGIVFWGSNYVRREQKGVFSRLMRLRKDVSKQRVEIPYENKSDRFFYHDLINQTHGVNLFLQNKAVAGAGLGPLEVETLISEVKLLQSMVQEHFGLPHKNLHNHYQLMPFTLAQKAIEHVIETFLPSDRVEKYVTYVGDLVNGKRLGPEAIMVSYPSLMRIITNLVKNISESQSAKVEFVFEHRENYLNIFIKNKVLQLKDNDRDLPKKLESLILEGSTEELQAGHGLGLESVYDICEELGGTFQFHLDGDYWVTEVRLPDPLPYEKPSVKAA